ncbi:MAG: hypothetical protein ACFFKA_09640 [Candidatus Thorarchaeota archaeon]
MSKIKKVKNNVQKYDEKSSEELFAFKSIIYSVIFSGILFIISVLLNGEIIPFFSSNNAILYTLGIILKVIIILLFFIFMMISIGNYKELSGKPIDFKITLLVFIVSIAQGFRNPLVFFFSFVGLVFILIYMYLVQES